METVEILDATETNLLLYGKFFANRSINSIIFEYTVAIDKKTQYPFSYIQKEEEFTEEITNKDKRIFSSLTTEPSSIKEIAICEENREYSFLIKELYLAYHSKAIYSVNNDPFILLLGETIKDIKAYHFDGKYGIHLFPNIWHSFPIVYYEGTIPIIIKENSSRMCASYNILEQHNKYFKVDYA